MRNEPALCVLGRAVGLALALAGCDGTAKGSTGAGPSRQWREMTAEFAEGLLLSVWGHTANNVWVVGGRPGHTVVLNGDQERLDPVNNPGRATAWWVCGLGDRVGIVGDAGLILVETSDGDFALLDLGIESTLYGCWGQSTEDFWVVGGDPLTGPAELARVQNQQAVAPDLGPLLPQLPRVLFKITGIGDELLIVGADGVLLRRSSAGTWNLERIAGAVPLFTVAAAAVDDVWAVGGTGSAVAVHFDGERWSEQAPELLPNLFGVSSVGGETVVAGSSGALAERNSDKWQIIDTATEHTFHSAWLDGEGGAWAVGGNVLEPDSSDWRGVVWAR